MDQFIETFFTKNARTDNGALTNSTSLNKCLDFFFIAGNHNLNEESFDKAFAENPQLAMRILFWSRDCRGGAGARKNFIAVMQDLQVSNPTLFSRIYKFIPMFGYWKDIYHLKPTPELVSFVAETLTNDKDHSLCAKYCPRKGIWFALLRHKLFMSPTEFRHYIVNKTQVVEQLMCANKWNEVEYPKVPSVAALRYSNLFRNHDGERYQKYLDDVNANKEKIHSDVLYPSDICIKSRTLGSSATRALWDNLPNYMEGCTERMLPVCDVSGSMMGVPMAVSVALGCYISERNEGAFKNAFITFSGHPTMQYLNGDIWSRFRQLEKAEWGMNTNLQAVFNLILSKAIDNNIPQELMPTKILIISDMRFDIALSNHRRSYSNTNQECTNFEAVKEKYALAGYKLPGIIFWNVNGNAGDVPVTMREENVGLVSGYSPSILKSVLQAKVLNPMEIMLQTVNSERYSCIEI